MSNEERINVLLWYCLVGTYAGLPLGVEGSPEGKWLRVVWVGLSSTGKNKAKTAVSVAVQAKPEVEIWRRPKKSKER